MKKYYDYKTVRICFGSTFVDRLTTQPREVLGLISSFLSPKDKLVLYDVNKYFRDIVKRSLGHSWVNLKNGYMLRDYQYSLAMWMHHRSKNKIKGICGGILALEMGLGKTLSCFAYCNMFPSPLTNNKVMIPYLVICGKTQLTIWRNELEKFFGSRLKCVIYHKDHMDKGEYEHMTIQKLQQYDYIITTYDICCNVSKKYGCNEKCLVRTGQGNYMRIAMIRSPTVTTQMNITGPKILYTTQWPRIFVDEAHKIRNINSKTFKAIMSLASKEKWCLSGTPLVNFKEDLYSLFKLCGYEKMPGEFSLYVYQQDKLTDAIMKVTMDDAGIVLPQRNVHIQQRELSQLEQEMYDLFLNNTQQKWIKLQQGKVKYIDVLTMFIRLRQICIAPYLITQQAKNTSNKEEKDMILQIKKEYPEYVEWLFEP